MEANLSPVSSLNDILFEGRNKAYGAYALRKAYNRELVKAAGISFSLVLLFFGCFYAWVYLFPAEESDPLRLIAKEKANELMIEPLMPKPVVPEEVSPPPGIAKSAAGAPTVATTAFKEIKIVHDLTTVTDVIPSQKDFTQTDPGLDNNSGELPGTSVNLEAEDNGISEKISNDVTIPFVAVEQMPEFPEGLAAMYKFINKHLRYPPQAQASGLEGVVILTFVVSATGQISDITVLQDIGGGAAEEAIRVIRKMPDWRPGRQNKQAVAVRFTLPVKFKIN